MESTNSTFIYIKCSINKDMSKIKKYISPTQLLHTGFGGKIAKVTNGNFDFVDYSYPLGTYNYADVDANVDLSVVNMFESQEKISNIDLLAYFPLGGQVVPGNDSLTQTIYMYYDEDGHGLQYRGLRIFEENEYYIYYNHRNHDNWFVYSRNENRWRYSGYAPDYNSFTVLYNRYGDTGSYKESLPWDGNLWTSINYNCNRITSY
jgi:hypothetical protein